MNLMKLKKRRRMSMMSCRAAHYVLVYWKVTRAALTTVAKLMLAEGEVMVAVHFHLIVDLISRIIQMF